MGFNPSYRQWTAANWMGRAGTAGDLVKQGWPVVARCTYCNLEMDVRLDVLVRAKGPDYVLWGKSARCRRRHCQGRMLFWTYPPEAKGARVEMW